MRIWLPVTIKVFKEAVGGKVRSYGKEDGAWGERAGEQSRV